MKYNWTEIFKNKTDKELYNIYVGESSLGSEAEEFAKLELENRNFNFKNLDKHRKKWELENLIEEEKSNSRLFFRSTRAWEYKFMAYGGLIITIIVLISIIRFFLVHKPIEDIATLIFIFIPGTIITIIGFVNYTSKKKREQYSEKRIKELIKEL